MIQQPVAVLAVLLGVLAALFAANSHPTGRRVFKVLPLLVFAYFVPTVLSNLGIIPLDCELYDFIKTILLPASLILLTLSVDIPAIFRLGPRVLILFFGATATIVIGGPLAYLAFGWAVPESLGDQAWKGLAALAGSWIGGTANMVAIGDSVGATDSTMSMIIVVDVAVANVWMAVLLYFAANNERMDAAIGADRRSLDMLRIKIEDYLKSVVSIAELKDYLVILFIAFGGTAVAVALSKVLPEIGDIIGKTTWVVLIVTTVGVGLSFTPLRKLEGKGASKIGSVFLYLLVATIGAKAEFAKVVNAPVLVAIGAVWMLFHAVSLLLLRRFLKAPAFYMAVGSKANIGGAASAPIVAGAFHPALAPVGVLLAVGGYVLGTYAGLLCAYLIKLVHMFHA